MPPKKQLSDSDQAAVKAWISAMKEGPEVASQPKVERHFKSGEEAIAVLVAEGWERAGVKPAAEVNDQTWCRRVYLDLAGRVPSEAELSAFLAAPKRDVLVDQLLASTEYSVRMRELWDSFLMGRITRGNPDGRRKGSGWAFLEHAFRAIVRGMRSCMTCSVQGLTTSRRTRGRRGFSTSARTTSNASPRRWHLWSMAPESIVRSAMIIL